jgi:hypothetical protein
MLAEREWRNHDVTTYTTAALAGAILRRLDNFGVRCLLFGGWAEEALGIVSPRPHRDIDLLLPAQSFVELDRLFESEFREIVLKRFAHKRAFVLEGAMVEVTLVQRTDQGAFTLFWGDVPFAWELPLDAECILDGQPVSTASRINLIRYREHHASTQPLRWKDPASLVF